MPRRLVLLAGPSGSGKSRLARRSGLVPVRLDDFYRDLDEPGLPRLADGSVDWDDVATWRPDAAAEALRTLLADGRVVVPDYSISRSLTVGTREVTAAPDAVLVAEGIFAPDLMESCRAAGVPVSGIYLDRPTWLVFALRLRRDLAQHRKPPLLLIRRGLRLARQDRALRARCVGLGFSVASMRSAQAILAAATPSTPEGPDA